MIRRPPRSTRFPCTTLFRSLTDAGVNVCLGTDSLATVRAVGPIELNMLDELQSFARTHPEVWPQDRKSTRLNSSHANISYAAFCSNKKQRSKKCITWVLTLI